MFFNTLRIFLTFSFRRHISFALLLPLSAIKLTLSNQNILFILQTINQKHSVYDKTRGY